eukprot:TRINITY_DN27076_c0_g1_i1.p1 TRINITY_DN27076_c0_g1~~TRINITY_DN27076_c0_g1_i1.p1  ORF type:complete len:485 (+),score=37.44 TRINITY_DN27076_c0_g1_i1:31-1485(+)
MLVVRATICVALAVVLVFNTIARDAIEGGTEVFHHEIRYDTKTPSRPPTKKTSKVISTTYQPFKKSKRPYHSKKEPKVLRMVKMSGSTQPMLPNCSHLAKPNVRLLQHLHVHSECINTTFIPSKKLLKGKFSILVTTYKGEATLHHTIQSWRASGLFAHARFHEVVFHVNKCNCNDLGVLEAVMKDTPYKALCSVHNKVHPLALISGISHLQTEFVLITENDRPILPRPHENTTQTLNRTQAYIDVALNTVQTDSTPYVFLERGLLDEDDALYEEVQKTNRDFDKAVGLQCASECYKWVKANADYRRAMVENCNADDQPISFMVAGKVHTKKKRKWRSCSWTVCREWKAWDAGTGDGPSTCLGPWLRRLKMSKSMQRRLVIPKIQSSPLLCFRQKGWSNGPAMIDLNWYVLNIASTICREPLDSGLWFKPSKQHFGYYGRRMENFLSQIFEEQDGYPSCRGVGLMDHVEIESYDTHPVHPVSAF